MPQFAAGLTDLPPVLTGPAGHALLFLIVAGSLVSFVGWGRVVRRLLFFFRMGSTGEAGSEGREGGDVHGLPVGRDGLFPYIELGLGYGTTSLFYFFLYLWGIPSGWLVGTWLVTGLGLAGYSRGTSVRASRMIPYPSGGLAKATLFVLGGVLLINAAMGFFPPLAFDSMEYHLFAPAVYVRQGELVFLKNNVYANFPQLVEMQYAGAMALTGSTYAGAIYGKLLNGLLFLVAVSGTGRLVKQVTGSDGGTLAAMVILAASPRLLVMANRAFVEIPYLYFVLCTVICAGWAVAPAVRQENDGWTGLQGGVLTGIFAGFAFSTKYPAFPLLVLPAATVVLAGRYVMDERIKPAVSGAVLLVVTALTVASPWLIRNAVNTGNPVYPLLYSVLDGEPLTDQNAARWRAAHRTEETGTETLRRIFSSWSLAGRVQVADDKTKPGDSRAGNQRRMKTELTWSPFLLLFLPLLIFVRDGPAPPRRWAFLLGGLLLFAAGVWWFFTHRLLRFLAPLFPLLAVLNAIGLVALTRKWKRIGAYLTPAVVGVGLIAPLQHVTMRVAPGRGARELRLVAGYTHPEQVLSELAAGPYPRLAAMGWINRNVPSDDRIGLVGEATAFYLRRTVDEWTVFDRNDTLKALLASTPSRTIEKLRSGRISWLLVNRSEMLRYNRTYSYSGPNGTVPGFPLNEVTERLQAMEKRGWIRQVYPRNDRRRFRVRVYRVEGPS